jgi:hypothetical protein
MKHLAELQPTAAFAAPRLYCCYGCDQVVQQTIKLTADHRMAPEIVDGGAAALALKPVHNAHTHPLTIAPTTPAMMTLRTWRAA